MNHLKKIEDRVISILKTNVDARSDDMDTIRDSIETEADKSLQRQEKKQHRESR